PRELSGSSTKFLTELGILQGTPVFSSAATAFAALVAVDVWEWTPFMMLFMLAGLLSMPQEPIEAAHIDGASAWRVFWHVQLPLLRPERPAQWLPGPPRRVYRRPRPAPLELRRRRAPGWQKFFSWHAAPFTRHRYRFRRSGCE
ncbi:MAG TPA: ABC transporter permease subunit, partial [Rhodocyclaceae bacterium]|nr:ABC transporter permease subunit [Rhodocyclaceae bacterium]